MDSLSKLEIDAGAVPLRTEVADLLAWTGRIGGLRPDDLLKALPAAVYVTDAAGRITFYNEAAAELWRIRPELGKSEWCGSWRLYWPDGRPMPHSECPMAIALKEKRAIRGAEAIAERPDGTRVPFLAYPTPLLDDSGDLTGAVNTLVDITDRKKAEEAARQLAAIVESSDDAIMSKDLKGIITSWNGGAERLYGYAAEEIVGKTVTTLIPANRHGEEKEILERVRRGDRIEHYETVRRCKDGSLVNVSLTVSPIKDAQGIVIGVSKIARDITSRKKADQVKQRLAAIVETSDDAIMSKDLKGTIKTWNPGAERLYGYAAEEIIGKPVTILIPADRQEEDPDIFARIRRGERIEQYETVRRRKDGSLVEISLSVSPIRNGRGRVIGAAKIARDITERKRAEERQRLLFREMNHRVKNLFTLAGTMVTLSARHTQTSRDLAQAVNERLVALARAHDLTLLDVTNGEKNFDRATTLLEVARTILAPYQSNGGPVSISGPDVHIGGKAAMGVALLLHEMATNAAKYGALTSETGCVAIGWRVEGGELKFEWRERGGPPIEQTPDKEGFGSLLARLTVTGRLHGTISRDWDKEGLTVRFSAPLTELTE